MSYPKVTNLKSVSLIQREESKEETNRAKPLFFALVVISVIGLGVAGTGLASFGAQAHQGWWAAGALSNLSQVDAIIMMSVGGTSSVLSVIIGIALNAREVEPEEPVMAKFPMTNLDHEALNWFLNCNATNGKIWTYIAQNNGRFTKVTKDENERVSYTHNILGKDLVDGSKTYDESSGAYLKTSPCMPTDLLITNFSELLEVGNYTFALQLNKKYSLVKKYQSDIIDMNDGTYVVMTEIHITDIHADYLLFYVPENLTFVQTSDLPSFYSVEGSTLISHRVEDVI